MHGQHGIPLLVGNFLQQPIPGVAGIVDDDVELAESGDGLVDGQLRPFGISHVAGNGNRTPAGSIDLSSDLYK